MNGSRWIKDKDFAFKLVNLEAKEEFLIWKAWEKRNEVIKDQNGNEIKFPIKDGQITDSAGKIHDVSEAKYIKASEWTQLFPNFSRKTRFVRNIISNNEDCLYGFSLTANKKLNDLIDTIKAMGNDPIKLEFRQEFDRNKSPADMYNIRLIQENASGSDISIKEKEIIDAYKSVHGEVNDSSKSAFVETLKSNDIIEDRALKLFEMSKVK